MNAYSPFAPPAFDAAQSVYGAMFDPEVRRRIRADPRQYALDNGLIDGDADIDIKVLTNAADTMYLAVSPAVSRSAAELSANELQQLSAAGSSSTAGSGSTASTLGTLCSTASSSTTLSTLATGGSA